MADGKKLAIIFPGIGYHTDKPLLYFSKKLAKELGFEVVEVSYTFRQEAQHIKGNAAEMQEAFVQAYAQTRTQLQEIPFADYQRVVMIGKSIGTVVAAKYAAEHLPVADQIVYTPVPETFDFLPVGHTQASEHTAHGPAAQVLVWHGQADPWCTDDVVMLAHREQNFRLELVADANHSLETPDVLRNLEILQTAMQQLKAFLAEPV